MLRKIFRYFDIVLFLLVISTLRCLADQTISQDLRSAQKSLGAGDYQKAYQEYFQLAVQENNHLAEFTLALFYENGWGRPMDKAAACQWYEKAAKGEIPAAAHFYAQCVQQGIGGQQSAAKAIQWYEKALELGHRGSHYPLAKLLLADNSQSNQAIDHLTQAALLGNRDAQLQLGNFYSRGEYVAKDLTEALNWSEAAAASGYLPAYLPTAKIYLAWPVDEQTGSLPAPALAKAYLWLSAADKRLEAKEDKAECQKLLTEVKMIMPESWANDLDANVEQHLAELAQNQ